MVCQEYNLPRDNGVCIRYFMPKVFEEHSSVDFGTVNCN